MLRGTLFFIALSAFLFGCKSAPKEQSLAEQAPPRTPVSVGFATDTVNIKQQVNLTAMATYLLKSDVKANTTGYITAMTIKLGDRVSRGQVLFRLETKEARALGNTINKLDKSFRFNGSTTVVSSATGFVAIVNHQIGDYVQDGEVLATITDASSFGFVLNLPYEYNNLIKNNSNILINLPDGTTVGGYVARRMPSVDSISQTQQVLIKIKDAGKIPENLIGNIQLTKEQFYGLAIPKSAVVSDETQSEFWVMKLINDSTAVKTTIEPGLQNDLFTQVKKGDLKNNDRVVLSGNYGLGDTATIQIQKK